MSRIVLIIAAVVISTAVSAEVEESIFLEAKKAASKNQWDTVFELKSEMIDHPLHPYLDYYYINRHFKTIDDAVIQQYIDTYPQSPMANKLRKRWLHEFAKNNQWDNFLSFYKPGNGKTLKCHHLHALHETGDQAKAFADIKSLWLTTKQQPESCTPVFNKWLNASKNKDELIMQRFELALVYKKFDLANDLVKKLSPQKKKDAKKILKLCKNPHLVAKKSFLDQKPIAEVVSYGIWRLARASPRAGINQWERLRKKYSFTPAQEQRIFQAIGLAMAVRKDSESTKWFRKVLGADLAPVYKDWMIRSAIIHKDWQLVIDSVDALKDEERNSLRWQYWYGRALQKLGKVEQANAILSQVGSERNYYGFMANYYLGKPITVKHHELKITADEFNAVKNTPGFQRAKLLYALNLKHDARVELFTLMKHITEKEQYIVTKLIAEWEWHTQALRLSHYPDHKDDITVRFPLPYHDHVSKNANQYHVDPALIYAIIRQESYFMPFAKSPAGAIGLMQLMPSTAKRTAKQFSISYQGEKDLVNGLKNIKLGTAHLKKLNQQLNAHPALVIAAYNAGKKAAKRWIPETSLPTDVWIETVSYYETRNYLRSVIASYVVYQHRLGMEPNLGDIMSPIITRASG